MKTSIRNNRRATVARVVSTFSRLENRQMLAGDLVSALFVSGASVQMGITAVEHQCLIEQAGHVNQTGHADQVGQTQSTDEGAVGPDDDPDCISIIHYFDGDGSVSGDDGGLHSDGLGNPRKPITPVSTPSGQRDQAGTLGLALQPITLPTENAIQSDLRMASRSVPAAQVQREIYFPTVDAELADQNEPKALTGGLLESQQTFALIDMEANLGSTLEIHRSLQTRDQQTPERYPGTFSKGQSFSTGQSFSAFHEVQPFWESSRQRDFSNVTNRGRSEAFQRSTALSASSLEELDSYFRDFRLEGVAGIASVRSGTLDLIEKDGSEQVVDEIGVVAKAGGAVRKAPQEADISLEEDGRPMVESVVWVAMLGARQKGWRDSKAKPHRRSVEPNITV